MAQLPPKIPNITPNWPEFSHHQNIPFMGGTLPPPPPPTTAAVTTGQNPSWVDEFLDFSSRERETHRRSVSDSVTIYGTPMSLCHNSDPLGQRDNAHNDDDDDDHFDRFDDEQLMSMFTDDLSLAVGPTLSSSNPSTSNSINGDDQKQTPNDHYMQQQQPKNEPEEVQSPCNSDTLPNTQPATATTTTKTRISSDSSVRISDPRRVKRVLANRQSAQRSRVRKLQYISELERSVTSLQAEVSVLSPRVAFLDHQRLVLNFDNSALKQRIAALVQDKIFKDAHQEALKREIERLRQVYHQQKNQQMVNMPPSPSLDTNGCIEKEEQLLSV